MSRQDPRRRECNWGGDRASDNLVLRTLEKEPERRYQQASEVKTAVESIPLDSPSLPRRRARATAPVPATRRWRRLAWPVGGAVFLLVFLAAAVCTALLPRTYACSARVQIDLPSRAQSAMGAACGFDPYFLLTEAEKIRSSVVLESVAERLRLTERWKDRYPGQGRTLTSDQARAILRERMTVRQVRSTSVIEIAVHDEQATGHAEIANAIAETYVAKSSPGSARVVRCGPYGPIFPSISASAPAAD